MSHLSPHIMPSASTTPASRHYAGQERRRSAAAPSADRVAVYVAAQALPAAEVPAAPTAQHRVIDEVQEAVCAAMAGEPGLFDLLKRRVLMHCARHPQAGGTAAAEIQRLLAVDIVERHFLACDKRRRLQRELQALAEALRVTLPDLSPVAPR